MQTGRPTASLQQVTIRTNDGRQLALGDSVGHWDLALRLLDEVVPNPLRDEAIGSINGVPRIDRTRAIGRRPPHVPLLPCPTATED